MRTKIFIIVIILNLLLPNLYYRYLSKKKKFFKLRLMENFLECFKGLVLFTAILIPGLYIILGMVLSIFIDVKSIQFFKDLWELYGYWGFEILFALTAFAQLQNMKRKYDKI